MTHASDERRLVTAQEELARYKRALPIVWALIAAGIDSKLAAMANPGTEEQDGKDSPDWKLAAQMAEMKDYVPGILTQKLIIRLLVDHEKAAARVKAAQMAGWSKPVADEDAPCLCTRKGDYEDVRGCPVHDA